MKNAVLGTCLSTLAHVFLYAGNVFWTRAGNLLHFILPSPKQFKKCNYVLMFKENHLIFPQKNQSKNAHHHNQVQLPLISFFLFFFFLQETAAQSGKTMNVASPHRPIDITLLK